MELDSLLLIDASALAVAAAVVDVRHQRIPNWLTYPGILLGLGLRSALFGWKGLESAVAGCLLAGGVVLVFYTLRAMGAGDVKLMAAIGSLVGPRQALIVLAATAISGGVLAMIYAAYRRRVGSTLRNVGSVLQFHYWGGLRSHPDLTWTIPWPCTCPTD